MAARISASLAGPRGGLGRTALTASGSRETGTTRIEPSSCKTKSSRAPASSLSAARIGAGSVTCPLLVSVASIVISF